MHVPPGMSLGPDPAAPHDALPPHPSGKKPTGGGWPAHNVAEISTLTGFLPALWGMWQAVSDPAINRRSSCKIKKEGSRIVYVEE